MLHRIWPRELRQGPLDVFGLLLLSHGFTPAEFASTAFLAWGRLLRHPPLSKLQYGYEERNAVAALFEDADGPDLGIAQTGSRLNLGADADARLRAYLETRSVTALGKTFSAADAWPLGGGGGRTGALVVVLCKGAVPGELYELTPTATLRTALVAVTVAGDHWELPIARGLCQSLAGLADEYELPGAEFERAPEALVGWTPPNVLIVTGQQRGQLAAGMDPAAVIPELKERLPVGLWETVSFHPHQGADANPPARRATDRVQLVEGAEGFRFNALRTDFDCLMRRRPYDPALPIQADVWLCKTCRAEVDRAITSSRNRPTSRRVMLHNQRPLFDDVHWPAIETVRAFPFRRDLTHGPPDPIWSCTAEVTAQDGLTITRLKLANRPHDPFTAATDVMSLIEFRDLEVELGDGRTEGLPASKAFAAQRGLAAPTLEIAFDGGPRKEFRLGIKLTAWFLVADTIAVQATYSLVLKDKAADIDPGGAALACKLYPQLSLLHVRAPVPPDPPPDEIPEVTALRGTVSVWCNNTVPASMRDELMQVDEHLGHMATGRNAATVMTDSNAGPRDAIYDGTPIPTHVRAGQAERHWKSGRRLGGVELSTESETVAAFALWLWECGLVPVLPHWSWLFDYATPELAGTASFVGSYALHEETEGGSPAATIRDSGPLGTHWPPASFQSIQRDHRLTVRKLPRQGAYDNVHVALDMGKDAEGRQVVSAPFCADKCLHIHWRWGAVALTGPGVRYAFHGWGHGHLDGGAHTVPAAPLIPPNQRLDVKVSKETETLTGVDYKVTAYSPGSGHAQVFLEQGISFAFAYSGLDVIVDIPRLAIAFGLVPSVTQLGVRRVFHEIYPLIRWFGEGEDVVNNRVQQVPGPPTSTASMPFLEKL